MKILVINSGSSTVKYAFFDVSNTCQLLKKGSVERIGEKNTPDHKKAFSALFEQFDKKEIDGVGHRIVHGGEKLKEPVLIDKKVMLVLKEAGQFAPLHSTPNLVGIEVAQDLLPSIPQVAVFDTAAYADLEPKAFLYGIPKELYEKHHIRRYGFHGINHSYVAKEASKLLEKKNLKVITCHLGSGCSISAFENGVSKDTSMGLTPLEGLVMGTRCGDIDPSIILYLVDVLGFQTKEITDLLNKKSGLMGLSGKNDMRDVHALAQKGDKWAQMAIELFVYRIQKYIGAYIAALNGVDAIVFTGGIGENNSFIREKVMSNFSYMGASIEKEKNGKNAPIFSTQDSKVYLLTIEANEELVIARETSQLLLSEASKTFPS